MNLLLINPNTTPTMTATVAAAAQAVTTAKIIAVQPDSGPVSIEGHYDAAFAAVGVLAELQKHPHADAVIIACFDDTGLHAARCLSAAPVVGIGEAAYHIASLVCDKFTVITTLARAQSVLENNLRQYGLAARCAKVRAAAVPVLDLEDPQSGARAKLSAEIQRALDEDGADGIVLGCAGMADLAHELQQEHGVPVIDGVVSAVKLAESLAALGVKTAKTGAYALPRAKEYRGQFAAYAPATAAKK